jgi:hypothetical protein
MKIINREDIFFENRSADVFKRVNELIQCAPSVGSETFKIDRNSQVLREWLYYADKPFKGWIGSAKIVLPNAEFMVFFRSLSTYSSATLQNVHLNGNLFANITCRKAPQSSYIVLLEFYVEEKNHTYDGVSISSAVAENCTFTHLKSDKAIISIGVNHEEKTISIIDTKGDDFKFKLSDTEFFHFKNSLSMNRESGEKSDKAALTENLFKIIESEFGVDKELITGKSRAEEVVIFRQIFSYLLIEKFGFDYYEVAFYTHRHRTTIYNSVDLIRDQMNFYNPKIKAKPSVIIETILNKLEPNKK